LVPITAIIVVDIPPSSSVKPDASEGTVVVAIVGTVVGSIVVA
jgi:hypothetical protein